MEQIVEHQPRLADVRTRALELEGEGPPLLLLHGFADSADTWRLVLDRLRRAGRCAVALDCPGFGSVAKLGGSGAIMPQLDAFLEAAVRRWSEGGGGVIIAGNSLGGVLALRAAQSDLPVRGIVPIAPAGLEMPTWFQLIQGEPVLRTLLTTPMPVPETAVRQIVGRLYRVLAFASARRVDSRIVDSFTSHIRSKADAVRILNLGRRLLPELIDPFELERIRCPVLLVWGDRDRMVSIRGAQLVIDQIPGTELVTLEGAGHCPQVEAPDRIAELLAEFAARPQATMARAARDHAAERRPG